MGAPNAPVNQLVAMMILKDGIGLSDEQLFEACRFHLLYRQALGCVNLSDSIPTESTYYKFRSDVEAYQREHDSDLFGQVFRKITSDQVIRFSLSGKQIRMDSTLIGSNSAFYSRFQLVHATMRLFYSDLSEQAISDMPNELALRMQQMTDEDAESMVHHSSSCWRATVATTAYTMSCWSVCLTSSLRSGLTQTQSPVMTRAILSPARPPTAFNRRMIRSAATARKPEGRSKAIA